MIEIAPGARVQIRDEEWLVRTADQCSVGGYQIACIGISETVRNREAIFLTAIDDVKSLNPEDTELVADESPEFISSLLYLEARLRQSLPTTSEIALGHRGAMDTLPFQLVPTALALGQLRPRFLIADAVGLGKTLEAGVLVSELMRRGRGRRILVVTTKSMMQQFQKEFWTRFTIPLTRLDSAGVQRIRRRIPATHNPFHYFDKTIISIDTLKRDTEYRHYLETAHWDIIVIDEAHNVSFKGNRTLNYKLATLLSERSDALIMLTATPHSGDKESFASLMRMLDPTVLPKKAEYTRADVDHLFVRRFKRDVRDEIRQEFPERLVFRFRAQPSAAEEVAFAHLAELKLHIDGEGTAGTDMLFRTTLEKSLFSSPAACTQTVRERVARIRAKDPAHRDIAPLEAFQKLVEAIDPGKFSKLTELVRVLKEGHADWTTWDPSVASDRIVLFTERIETLMFLREQLPKQLGLPDKAVATLYGTLGDGEMADVVESFGKTHSPLRLLIASDVASEGLNLHFQSHRLIHFDIPWSLMVFQQRNGRVDRYGQRETPLIAYLSTDTTNQKVRGDLRILEILIAKDEQAAKNIGDPSIFMGLFDEDAETRRVAQAMETGESADQFESTLKSGEGALDWLDALMTPAAQPTTPAAVRRAPLSLFASDFEYARRGFEWLGKSGRYSNVPRSDQHRNTIEVRPDDDLHRFLDQQLADEMVPTDRVYSLCANPESIKNAIATARDTDRWPVLQYLWPLHPVLQWLDYKLLSMIGRQTAPVIRVRRGLATGECLVLISALIPNRRGQPVIDQWFAVHMKTDGSVAGSLTIDEVMGATGLGREELPNALAPINVDLLRGVLPIALAHAKTQMTEIHSRFRKEMQLRSKEELGRLAELFGLHKQHLELDLGKKDQKLRDLNDRFSECQRWVTDTLEIDSHAHLTVAAVITS